MIHQHLLSLLSVLAIAAICSGCHCSQATSPMSTRPARTIARQGEKAMATNEQYIFAKIRPDHDQHITSNVQIMLITPSYISDSVQEAAFILIAPCPNEQQAEFCMESDPLNNNSPIIHVFSGFAYMATGVPPAEVQAPRQSGVEVQPPGPRGTLNIFWARPRLRTDRVIAAGVGTRMCVQVRVSADRVFYRAGRYVDIAALKGAKGSGRLTNNTTIHEVDDTGVIPASPVNPDSDAQIFIGIAEQLAHEAGVPGT